MAPEFDISDEAQVAHSGIFDLIIECGGDDSLLVPIDKKDKKHGDSVGIYYSPIINIFWAVSYLLRNIPFRDTRHGKGYYNARAKMELISIDAAIAHHPVVGNRMMNPGPRPLGTPLALWPPPFDEVHASNLRGGLGNLGLLLRWDTAASALRRPLHRRLRHPHRRHPHHLHRVLGHGRRIVLEHASEYHCQVHSRNRMS